MNKYTISVSNAKTLIVFIAQALNNKLYVNKQYQLFNIMRSILITCIENCKSTQKKFNWVEAGEKKSRLRYICSLAFNENNEPIGCLFIMGYHSHIYVKPEYRNLGIASSLLTETAKQYNITTRLLNYGISRSANKLKRKFNIAERLHSLHVPNDLQLPRK